MLHVWSKNELITVVVQRRIERRSTLNQYCQNRWGEASSIDNINARRGEQIPPWPELTILGNLKRVRILQALPELAVLGRTVGPSQEILTAPSEIISLNENQTPPQHSERIMSHGTISAPSRNLVWHCRQPPALEVQSVSTSNGVKSIKRKLVKPLEIVATKYLQN
jgi:hypothetical protein